MGSMFYCSTICVIIFMMWYYIFHPTYQYENVLILQAYAYTDLFMFLIKLSVTPYFPWLFVE